MKTYYNFTPLDSTRFKRQIETNFPPALMTQISIIQGVAFYFLINNLVQVFLNNGEKSLFFLVYPILSFACIVVVFFLYSWFISVTYRTPDFKECLIPFLLGLAEIIPMHSFGTPKYWWLFFAVFCCMGMVALRSTLIGLKVQSFGKGFEEAYEQSCSEERKNIYLSFALVIISLVAFLVYPSQPVGGAITFGWHDWVPVSLTLLVTIIMVWTSQFRYLRRLYEIYGLSIIDSNSLDEIGSGKKQNA